MHNHTRYNDVINLMALLRGDMHRTITRDCSGTQGLCCNLYAYYIREVR